MKREYKIKKIFYAIGLLLILMTLKPFSCSFNSTTVWTVSGTTIFNGTPDAGTTIKLAAFYGYIDSLVSNVVTVTDGGAFSLDIDASELEPDEEDRIWLNMWEDDNLNNEIDIGENWVYLVPEPDCPVWVNSINDCYFIWFNEGKNGCIVYHGKGWNVLIEFFGFEGVGKYKSVIGAVLTGARITNDPSF